jgi:hypothetical protein
MLVSYAVQKERRRLSAKLLILFNMKITDGRKLVMVATTAAETVLFIIIIIIIIIIRIRIRISDINI